MSASDKQAPALREDIERLSREVADLQTRLTKLQSDMDMVREVIVRLAKTTGF